MKKYNIYLYPGFGIELAKFTVKDVYHEQDAIEKLCRNLSNPFFIAIEDCDEEELVDFEAAPDEWLYVDSTSYGGKCGYLYIVNMKIEEL